MAECCLTCNKYHAFKEPYNPYDGAGYEIKGICYAEGFDNHIYKPETCRCGLYAPKEKDPPELQFGQASADMK